MDIPERDWSAIARLRAGDLEDFPFPLLLCALARERRTTVVRFERPPVEKAIGFVDGIPVECRSNLAHETFGRYLVNVGKLSESQFVSAMSEALKRGVRLGEVLIEREVLSAEEVYRQLQQNLARKLLDPFGWQVGSFVVDREAPPAETTLKVMLPRLILTGVSSLSPQGEVERALEPWVGKPLALHPQPPVAPASIRHVGVAGEVLQALGAAPRTLDELVDAGDDRGAVERAVYGLTLLEVVIPAERVATIDRETEPEAAAGAPVGTPVAADDGEDLTALTGMILESHLAFRRWDAFEMLQVDEEAGRAEIDAAFLERARVFAPWRLEAQELTGLATKAEALFLAAAAAYGELADPESRARLLERRRTLRERRDSAPKASFEIETDLLDAEAQYRKGLELLEAGKTRAALECLQFAADCDPQSPVYRAEAAHCRYTLEPRVHKEQALRELESALRIDPHCGMALYRMGSLLASEGHAQPAEDYLRRAIRPMAPDRRPIDALRELRRSAS